MCKRETLAAPQKAVRGLLAVACAAAAAGAVMSAAAQDAASDAASAGSTGSLVMPGQPFNGGPPSPSASTSPSAQEPGEESAGLGRLFMARASLARTFTDNLYYMTDSAPNKVQAWGWALQPIVAYQDNLPRLQFRAVAGATLQTLNSPGQHDDYADAIVSTGAFWEPFREDRLGLNGSLVMGHDPFGTNRTEGGVINPAQLDDWRMGSVSLNWLHGVSISGLSVEGSISALDKTYYTNQFYSNYLDYNELTGQGIVYYAISPKTQLLVDFSATQVQTPNIYAGEANQGGTLYQVLGGVRWLATAKTSGDLRVGALKREFVGGAQPAFTGFDWLATVRWNPARYREFALDAGQSSQQSYLTSSGFLDVQSVALNWTEHWSPLLLTRATANAVDLKFVNDNAGRVDHQYFGAVYASYSVTRAVSVYGTGAFGRRDSNVVGADYSRADVFAGVKVAFAAD